MLMVLGSEVRCQSFECDQMKEPHLPVPSQLPREFHAPCISCPCLTGAISYCASRSTSGWRGWKEQFWQRRANMAMREQQQALRRGSLAAACLLLASLSGEPCQNVRDRP